MPIFASEDLYCKQQHIYFDKKAGAKQVLKFRWFQLKHYPPAPKIEPGVKKWRLVATFVRWRWHDVLKCPVAPLGWTGYLSGSRS